MTDQPFGDSPGEVHCESISSPFITMDLFEEPQKLIHETTGKPEDKPEVKLLSKPLQFPNELPRRSTATNGGSFASLTEGANGVLRVVPTPFTPNVELTNDPAIPRNASGPRSDDFAHGGTPPACKPESKIVEEDGESREFRELHLDVQTKSIEEFRAQWNESARMNNLDNGPFRAVIRELGEQLAHGRLNPEKIQILLKSIRYPEEELEHLAKSLRFFAADIHEMYGIKPIFEYSARNGVKSLTIAENKMNDFHHNTSIRISETGQPEAMDEYRGFNVGSGRRMAVDQVMNKLSGLIRAGRKDLRPDMKAKE